MSGTIVFIHGSYCTGTHWKNYKGYSEERGYA